MVVAVGEGDCGVCFYYYFIVLFMLFYCIEN